MTGLNDVGSEIENAIDINQGDEILGCNQVRDKYIKKLYDYTDRNVVLYYSGWLTYPEYDNNLLINDLDTIGFMNAFHKLDKAKGLDLILHTPGGNISVTESLVSYFKKIFGRNIRAFVPQLAMSASTMIACSCKEIWMGKQSNLGPFDPQYDNFPAFGILEEFENAAKEISVDPSKIPVWQTILSKYNPTVIGECQKAIKLSKEIVENWLKSNMLKDDPKMDEKISSIFDKFINPENTYTHDRHIDSEECNDAGLKIIMLENHQNIQDIVLDLHYATMMSIQRNNLLKLFHNNLEKVHSIS